MNMLCGANRAPRKQENARRRRDERNLNMQFMPFRIAQGRLTALETHGVFASDQILVVQPVLCEPRKDHRHRGGDEAPRKKLDGYAEIRCADQLDEPTGVRKHAGRRASVKQREVFIGLQRDRNHRLVCLDTVLPVPVVVFLREVFQRIRHA